MENPQIQPTSWCTAIDFDVPESRRDEIDYISLYRAGYDGVKRQLTQVASLPWTEAKGESWAERTAAVQRWAEKEATANTTDKTDFEVHVMGAGGVRRILTRRLQCVVVAPATPDTGLADQPDAQAGASLEAMDALAAAPAMRAVLVGSMKGAELNEFILSATMRSVQALEAGWDRRCKSLEADMAVIKADRDLAHTKLNESLTAHRQLLDALSASVGGPSVAPEIVQDAVSEVGSTLKTLAMHFMGAPTEMASVLDALKDMPDEIRGMLLKPDVLKKLTKPETIMAIKAFLQE
jgi:hypothetical protein